MTKGGVVSYWGRGIIRFRGRGEGSSLIGGGVSYVSGGEERGRLLLGEGYHTFQGERGWVVSYWERGIIRFRGRGKGSSLIGEGVSYISGLRGEGSSHNGEGGEEKVAIHFRGSGEGFHTF